MSKRLFSCLFAILATNFQAVTFGSLIQATKTGFDKSKHAHNQIITILFTDFVQTLPNSTETNLWEIEFLHPLLDQGNENFEIKFPNKRVSFPGEQPLEVLQLILIAGCLDVVTARHRKKHSQEEFLASLCDVIKRQPDREQLKLYEPFQLRKFELLHDKIQPPTEVNFFF